MARLARRVRVYRGRGPAARDRQERLAEHRVRGCIAGPASRRVPARERQRGTHHRGGDGQAARTGVERKGLRRRVLV